MTFVAVIDENGADFAFEESGLFWGEIGVDGGRGSVEEGEGSEECGE